MEIILYFTGGIALLALAYLFISLASTMKTVRQVLVESQSLMSEAKNDLHALTQDVTDLKSQITPIIGNINNLTVKANGIVDGVQSQLITIQATIDDTLDVVRGTIDDVERLKDELVSTVEGPVKLVQNTVGGTVGAIRTGYSFIQKIMGNKKPSRNGQSEHSKKDSEEGERD